MKPDPRDSRIAVRCLLRVGLALLAAWLSLPLMAGLRAIAEGNPQSRISDVGVSAFTSNGASAGYPNCRFGVGGGVEGYAVTALNVGWYLDFGSQVSPTRPNGAEYIQIIRLQPDLAGYVFSPPTDTLNLIADNNRGATWLVGNEPDSPWQDRLTPQVYARAYHHLYHLIKARDASAQVGIAGVVQPTPLRLQYLDLVLDAYQQYFGERLPSDLWNIHSYILPETQNCFDGACIPPGITATQGIVYSKADMFSTSIFQQRLVDFRTWMRDRGYQDRPLYITEYGTLYPYPPYLPGDPYVDENQVPMTEDRTAKFMTDTFNILLQMSDATIGHPADAGRLVQRWLWYSVSDTHYGGPLFDPTSLQRRPLGDVFYSYTHAIPPAVDLLAVRVIADPAAISDTGQLQTTTLKAMVSNVGNISVTAPVTVAFYAGQPPSGTLIGTQAITGGLSGCAGTGEVSSTWSGLAAGGHPMYIAIDPGATISETDRSNNVASGFALVATHRLYVPVVLKAS